MTVMNNVIAIRLLYFVANDDLISRFVSLGRYNSNSNENVSEWLLCYVKEMFMHKRILAYSMC